MKKQNSYNIPCHLCGEEFISLYKIKEHEEPTCKGCKHVLENRDFLIDDPTLREI
jgi:formylmethanofuran dehydrogenase subunit E